MLSMDLQLFAGYIDGFVNWTAKAKKAQEEGRELKESSEFYSDKITWMIMYGCCGMDSEEIYSNIFGMVTENDATPFIGNDHELAELLCALSDEEKMKDRAKANEKDPDEEYIFCEAVLLDFFNQKFAGMNEDDIYFVLIELGDNK